MDRYIELTIDGRRIDGTEMEASRWQGDQRWVGIEGRDIDRDREYSEYGIAERTAK